MATLHHYHQHTGHQTMYPSISYTDPFATLASYSPYSVSPYSLGTIPAAAPYGMWHGFGANPSPYVSTFVTTTSSATLSPLTTTVPKRKYNDQPVTGVQGDISSLAPGTSTKLQSSKPIVSSQVTSFKPSSKPSPNITKEPEQPSILAKQPSILADVQPLLAEEDESDEHDHLRETFNLFDKDGSGTISISEFQSILSVMGQNSSKEDVQQMLSKVDYDGSGEIDYDEFCQLMNSAEANEITRAELKKYFNAFDQDLSGYITGAEMRHMMTGLGQDLRDDEIDELMNQYDGDGSGQITIDEFEELVVDLGFTLIEGEEEEEEVDIKIGVPEPEPISDEPVDVDQIDFKKLFESVTVDGKVRISEVQAAVESLKQKQSLTSLDPEANAALHWTPGREKIGLGEVIYKANHIAIIVADVGRSAAFYSNILGLQQIRRPDFDRHGAWFTMGNLELHLIKGVPLVHSGEDLIVGHISIETYDIDKVPEILKRLEVPFRQNVSVPKGVQMKDAAGKTNDSNTSSAIVKQYFIRDPDGYYIEVCNCDVLTAYCLGKKEELGGYDEGVKPLDSKDAILCTNIGLRLANSCRRRSKDLKRKLEAHGKSLKGAPAAVVAKILGFSPAEVVDQTRLDHLIKRSTVYGDVCQNENPEDLKEILLLAGNEVPKAVQIIQFRAGGDQVFRPPAFFEQGEEKYVPRSFKVSSNNTAVGLAAEARYGTEAIA